MKKKIFSLILLLMIFSIFTINIFASGGTITVTTNTGGHVEILSSVSMQGGVIYVESDESIGINIVPYEGYKINGAYLNDVSLGVDNSEDSRVVYVSPKGTDVILRVTFVKLDIPDAILTQTPAPTATPITTSAPMPTTTVRPEASSNPTATPNIAMPPNTEEKDDTDTFIEDVENDIEEGTAHPPVAAIPVTNEEDIFGNTSDKAGNNINVSGGAIGTVTQAEGEVIDVKFILMIIGIVVAVILASSAVVITIRKNIEEKVM